MKTTRPRFIISILATVVIVSGIFLAATGPASAAPTLPASAQSCSSGQPKLDYEYQNQITGVFTWSNVCGENIWPWELNGDWALIAIRMPTTPTHRVWLHVGSASLCLWSTDDDLYMINYGSGSDPEVWEYPDNIQVSANTSSC